MGRSLTVWVKQKGYPRIYADQTGAHVVITVSRRIATLSYVSDTVYAGKQYFRDMWGR